jgi:hypothetical protein
MDVYSPTTSPEYGRCPNCWMISSQEVPAEDIGEICFIREARNQIIINVTSHTPQCAPKIPPRDFWDVIEGWGETWIWNNLKVVGDPGWLEASITDNSCITVMDGSYMKQIFPNICSAAFIFECGKGRGHIIGYFVEHSPDAGSFRGELLGLIAIHLILKGVHDFSATIRGSVQIISNCMGALNKV